MSYVKSREHFINVCCKRLRDFGITFRNQDEFKQDLCRIYQISQETRHLIHNRGGLADCITWQLYQKTEKEQIRKFFCVQMHEIVAEALRINNNDIEGKFNYLEPIKKGDVLKYKKIRINGVSRTISDEAIHELNKLHNCYGVYFIYNDKNQLLYIGKSKNLANRIPESTRERNGAKFAYILTVQPADIHILEPYLILKYKPIENTEFIEHGNTSFNIDCPKPSRIIPFYEENENEVTK